MLMLPEKLQRFLAWLVPLLLFLVLLCVFVAGLRVEGEGLVYLSDTAYAHLTVARNLLEHGTYGLATGEPAMRLADTLWRYAIAGMTYFIGQGESAALVLAALLSIVTILLVVRFAFALRPNYLFAGGCGLLVVLVSPTVLGALTGTSQVLATTLVTAGCIFHVEGLGRKRKALPFLSLLCFCLAVWIRLEFIFVPVLLGVHGLFVSKWCGWQGQGSRISMYGAIVRGMLVPLLIAAPLFLWNFSLIGVGWPRVPTAPMPLDLWAGSPPEALHLNLQLALNAIPDAFGALVSMPFMQAPLPRWMLWLGLVVLSGQAIQDATRRPFTVVLHLVLLLPLCLALGYPYLGQEGMEPVLLSLGPLCAVVAAYGVMELPALLEKGFGRLGRGPRAQAVLRRAFTGVLAAFLVVPTVLFTLRHHNDYRQAANRKNELRVLFAEQADNGLFAIQALATDEPGWPAYAGFSRVVDLTGQFNPETLRCVAEAGGLDAECLGQVLQDPAPNIFMLWTPAFKELALAGPRTDYVSLARSNATGAPRVYEITWPGAL